jgi:hypothetical protein
MRNDTLYNMALEGKTIWVTVARPAIFNPATNQYEENKYIAAFKIGEEPKMLDGEYIKEGGKVKFFNDHNEALCAALAAARGKIMAAFSN